MLLLTLTPIDGPSTCLWPITGVPQVGQNFIVLAFHKRIHSRRRGWILPPYLMDHGLLSELILLQCPVTLLHYERII